MVEDHNPAFEPFVPRRFLRNRHAQTLAGNFLPRKNILPVAEEQYFQIEDGVNGFLVSSIDEAAERIVQLLKDKKLCEQMGRKARESVREKFLLTRYVEQYLDLFAEFETSSRPRE